MNKYWRFSYNGIGIYEALKKVIWKNFSNPKEEWNILKKSEAFTWLNVPSIYPENSNSYFTLEGYQMFIEKSYPLFIKYLDKEKILVEEFLFDEENINIVYKDEYQIVKKN